MSQLPDEIALWRQEYRDEKARLSATLLQQGVAPRGVRQVLRQLALSTDRLLVRLWEKAGFGVGFSLIAVGGFGRGELFPHSDVDVLVLLPDGTQVERDDSLKTRIESFIGSCWDAGLEIGSSVRTMDECVAESSRDVTIQTSLLECRLLTGSRTAFRALVSRLGEAMDPKAFFVAKTLEMRQRHQKFENTPYALEPNCKESPGGLRDLQIILWVARAAGYGRSWDELARNGLATPFEVRQLKRNEAMLNLIRLRLHLVAGGAKTGWCSTCRPPWPTASATAPTPRKSGPRCAPANR